MIDLGIYEMEGKMTKLFYFTLTVARDISMVITSLASSSI